MGGGKTCEVINGFIAGLNTIDAENVGRYKSSTQRNREKRLMRNGFKATMKLESVEGRVQIILTPDVSFTEISTPEYAATCPFRYHISLCYERDCSPDEIAHAAADVDDWTHIFSINRITKNYVVCFHDLQLPESVRLLHARGWHSEMSCSM